MPFVFLGFDGTIGFEKLGFPLPEILLLRQLLLRAQPVEQRGVGWLLVEIGWVEVPQNAIGRVVERQPVVGVEHRHACGQQIERAAVRVDQPRQRDAHGLGFGGVDADAGAAVLGSEIEDIECSPRAGDHGGKTAGKAVAGNVLVGNGDACVAVEQFKTPRDRVGGIFGLDRAGVSRIDERQFTRGIAGPGPVTARVSIRVRSDATSVCNFS